ncbi:nucleoside-triphosphatase [Lacinutrix iliipiscaria]|uniref:Nucleoside-triphosphatase n=1 Tax=Lacinutrix iliipiscaria TaxID=1230532 RepID=A0ABW5WM66_9FLAO
MIYILTDEIRTGKTTALLEWVSGRAGVDGLLCPDDDNGKRYFLKIKSKEGFKLEADFETEAIINIGSFKFLQSAFKKANDYIIKVAEERAFQYLVIDEIGKLELKKEGLHVSAERLISTFISDKKQHVILVVRDYLLDSILQHYDISEYQLISKSDLTKNSFA